ncbi:MAG: alpha/beta hydrolase [Solirubrobacterales bacterium]|nr:alpha/beta hydrolase [Solirubrobacterales bacterium]
MPTSRSTRSDCLVLSDGRRLAFTDSGPEDGVPVFYCHGAIGTPVSGTVDLDAICARLGVRYIAPSRPGIGGSDPAPGRTIRSWATDLRELADALGLDRFYVVGVSAGGPYALAASHALRSRVRRVAVVSSLSPLCALKDTPGLRKRIRYPLALLERAPRTVVGFGNAVLPLLSARPALLNRVMEVHAARSERARLATAVERSAAATSFFDSCAGGVGGLVSDYGVYSSSWGFDASEVYSEVDVWHGSADPLVPVEHALVLAAALPHSHVYVDPEEGHHFFRANLERILGVLVGTGEVTALRALRQPPADKPRPGARAAAR